MVIAEAYYSGVYRFDAREKPIFDSRITKFVFRSSGDLHFVILGEDSDSGWNTYLFFNFHIVNFVWEIDEGEVGNIILLIFVLWGCFNCRWVKVEAESLIWGQLKLHPSVPAFFANWLG